MTSPSVATDPQPPASPSSSAAPAGSPVPGRTPGRRRPRPLVAAIVAIAAGTLLALLVAWAALAAGTDPSDKVLAGNDILIPAGTTVSHDVYAFGGTVTVDGTIDGDLIAAAGRVVVTGAVTGDVLATGSVVTITGSVGGDVRAGAAQLEIGGTVAQDVATLASVITVDPGAAIGGDLLFNATAVTMDGTVAGGVLGSATDYQRGGSVTGSEQVALGSRLDQPAVARAQALALDALRQYVMVLLVGLVLLRFAPGFVRAAAERTRRQPLASSGLGVVTLLAYLGILIAGAVAMVLVGLIFSELNFGDVVVLDVVGTVLGGSALTFALVVFATFVADAIVGLAVGRLVSVSDQSPYADTIQLAVGAALVVIVTSFPEIGGLVKLLVILVALGAVSAVVLERRRARPGPVQVPPAPA